MAYIWQESGHRVFGYRPAVQELYSYRHTAASPSISRATSKSAAITDITLHRRLPHFDGRRPVARHFDGRARRQRRRWAAACAR